jgi:hypothetical protein
LGFEKVASTACAADIEPATKTAICATAVVGSVTALLYGAYKALSTDRMLKERQILDVRAPSQTINLVPQIAGKSHTNALYEQYTGIPILIGYHDCFGPGCFEIYYQNHMSKGGRLLHHVSVRHRHNTTTLARRQDEQESGDDSGLYGDYLYHNDNEGTEEGLAGAENQTNFEDNLEHDVDIDEWTNTGIHCFNVYDSDTGVVGSAGYFSLNNDTPHQDPDNEDSYSSQCERARASQDDSLMTNVQCVKLNGEKSFAAFGIKVFVSYYSFLSGLSCVSIRHAHCLVYYEYTAIFNIIRISQLSRQRLKTEGQTGRTPEVV